jgi:hypothetical protein
MQEGQLLRRQLLVLELGLVGPGEGLDLLRGDQANPGGDLHVQEGWSGDASLYHLLGSVTVAPLPPLL